MHILVRVQLYTIHVVGRLSKVYVVRAMRLSIVRKIEPCLTIAYHERFPVKYVYNLSNRGTLAHHANGTENLHPGDFGEGTRVVLIRRAEGVHDLARVFSLRVKYVIYAYNIMQYVS